MSKDKIISWIIRFLQLQLFITLIAMPILLSWGLPISLLSPVGNLIFSPLLTIFLFLSSLFFFTQIFCIPNQWIAWLLEKITQGWLYAMHIDPYPWLFGFAKPSLALLIIILVVSLLIVHYKHFKHRLASVICLALLLCGSCCYISVVYSTQATCQTLPCNKGNVTLLHVKNQLILIDPGVIGQRISAPSWVEYTLIPHILKTSGKTSIDHVIVLQPGCMIFQALATLVHKMNIKKIYLPLWRGSLTKNEWKQFFLLKKALQEKNVIVERIGAQENAIVSSPDAQIIITPLQEQITQKEITYNVLHVHGAINGQQLQIWSQKSGNNS